MTSVSQTPYFMELRRTIGNISATAACITFIHRKRACFVYIALRRLGPGSAGTLCRYNWALGNFGGSVFRCVLSFMAKRYPIQQKCLKKWTGSALLRTRGYNFQPLHRLWAPQYTSSLQTDGQADDIMMAIDCVTRYDRLKRVTVYSCPNLHQILIDYKTSFTDTLSGNFAINYDH